MAGKKAIRCLDCNGALTPIRGQKRRFARCPTCRAERQEQRKSGPLSAAAVTVLAAVQGPVDHDDLLARLSYTASTVERALRELLRASLIRRSVVRVWGRPGRAWWRYRPMTDDAVDVDETAEAA